MKTKTKYEFANCQTVQEYAEGMRRVAAQLQSDANKLYDKANWLISQSYDLENALDEVLE